MLFAAAAACLLASSALATPLMFSSGSTEAAAIHARQLTRTQLVKRIELTKTRPKRAQISPGIYTVCDDSPLPSPQGADFVYAKLVDRVIYNKGSARDGVDTPYECALTCEGESTCTEFTYLNPSLCFINTDSRVRNDLVFSTEWDAYYEGGCAANEAFLTDEAANCCNWYASAPA